MFVMKLYRNFGFVVVVVVAAILQAKSDDIFEKIDKKYMLVHAAYRLAQDLFQQGQNSYKGLKEKSLEVIDTFLELVTMMNDEMAAELRSAVVKFYKIKYFHDFTNYVISMEEMIDIIEHCLIEPVEKLRHMSRQFRAVIGNFQDARDLAALRACARPLPDEVAAAHCALHQAVLFNETMQDSLVSIVEIKTRQHVEDMNTTLVNVQRCLNDFVPNFYEQLLVDAYTWECGYMKVINASLVDLLKDKWRSNTTVFARKWSPLVKLLRERLSPPEPMLHDSPWDMIRANADSADLKLPDDSYNKDATNTKSS